MGTPSRNGLETYRRLVREYEPNVAGRRLAMLSGIMTANGLKKVRNESDYLTALSEWEDEVESYQKLTGVTLDEAIKVAILTDAAPDDLKQHIQINADAVTDSYIKLKNMIISYVRNKRNWHEESTLMEVDAVE